jgi:small subunit ribosomal protein S6
MVAGDIAVAGARLRETTPAPPGGRVSPEEVALREYEVMVIVDETAEDKLEAVVERVTQIVTGGGGEVTKIDRWGKRKFAYEIDHKTDGFYLVIVFTADTDLLGELERVLLLADEVVRHKVVRREAA